MNIIELIIYMSISSVLLVAFFQSFLPLTSMQRSLEARIDTSYELLIDAIE